MPRSTGSTSPEQLFARLGGKRRYVPTLAALDPASTAGRDVVRLLNVDDALVPRLSNHHPDPGAMSVLGDRVATGLTDFWCRQVCPACLRDEAYHRASWLIAAMPACPRHRLLLLRRCPACEAQLNWNGGVHVCPRKGCRFDLRKAVQEPLPAGDERGIAGLAALLGGGTHSSGLAFGDALRAALTLGRIELGLPPWRKIAGFVDDRRLELPAILAAGWRVLEPWPASYHAFLEARMAHGRKGGVSYGLKAALGEMGGILGPPRPWTAPLVAQTGEFAAGRTDVAIHRGAAERYAAGSAEAVRNVSITEAARMCGVTHDTMNRTAARLRLHVAAAVPGVPRMLDGRAVRRLAAAALAQPLLSAKQVAGLLDVSTPTLTTLVDAGLLAKVPDFDRVEKHRCYDRRDVDGLLGAFERAAHGAPRIDGASGPAPVSTKGRGTSWVVLARAVLRGERKPSAVLVDRSGLPRYRF